MADDNAVSDDMDFGSPAALLCTAATRNDVDGLRALLAQGVPAHALFQGRTALACAAFSGAADAASLLIQAGADVNFVLPSSRTAVHTAAGAAGNRCDERGRVLRLLLDSGGDVRVVSETGETPLMHAAAAGTALGVRMLLDAGADPQYDVDQLLRKAASNRLHGGAMLRALREAGVPLSGAHQSEPGRTSALHVAVRCRNAAAVRELVGAGVDASTQDARGDTPLHVAAFVGELEIADMLVAHGCDLGARNAAGRTPTQVASACGREHVALALQVPRGE